MKPKSSISARQEKALAALLTEVTIETAAKNAGVTDVTMWRWMREPEFRRRYQEARRQIVEEAVGLMQRASKRAVATLVKNLDCGNPSVEVRSAQVILEQSFKGVELLELEARMSFLEEHMPAEVAGQRGYR
jgi:hypothetical protein